MEEQKFVWLVIFGDCNSVIPYETPEKAVDFVCEFLRDNEDEINGLRLYDEFVTYDSYEYLLKELQNENHFYFIDNEGNDNILSVERFEIK